MPVSSGEFNDLVQRGYRFALSLTHEAANAEDLLQDAWFSVLKIGGPWTREYLFTTIRNRFIDQYRRDRRIQFEALDDHGHETTEFDAQFWDEDGSVFSMNGSLTAALEQLRPEERAVLYLTAVEDYTADQVSKLLEWPRGTVLSLLRRAREKLRRRGGDKLKGTA